jgi:SAM-dependent methyltransferase
MVKKPMDTQTSYDAVAAEYAQRFYNEMERKAFDRKMLEWLAEKVGGQGVICDMGCGPGQIARYLHGLGVAACGIDLSPEMIAHARQLNPDIPFDVGNMLDLAGVEDGAFGGIAAFYCLIHIPRPQIGQALGELWRVLRPGGTILLTFHIGQEVRHLEEWWGQDVNLDFQFFEREEMKTWLTEAGFVLDEVLERDPHPDVEVATRRGYIFASK